MTASPTDTGPSELTARAGLWPLPPIAGSRVSGGAGRRVLPIRTGVPKPVGRSAGGVIDRARRPREIHDHIAPSLQLVVCSRPEHGKIVVVAPEQGLLIGAPLDQVFLMKVHAGRAADLPDIKALWPKAGFQSTEEAASAFVEAYPLEAEDPYLADWIAEQIR